MDKVVEQISFDQRFISSKHLKRMGKKIPTANLMGPHQIEAKMHSVPESIKVYL